MKIEKVFLFSLILLTIQPLRLWMQAPARYYGVPIA